MKHESYSVNARIRKDKTSPTDGTCPIILLLRYDHQTRKLSTRLKIKRVLWDDKKNRAKSAYEFSASLNQVLLQEKSKVEEFILRKKSLGEAISIDDIVSFYRQTDEPNETDFLEYYRKSIESYKSKLSSSTIRIYYVSYRKLKTFMPRISMKDVNEDLILGFDDFLLNHERNTRTGAVNKHKHTKKIISKAIREKLLSNNPYHEHPHLLSEEIPNKDYLTEKEIKIIEQADLTANSDKSKINQARDMFIFSCYTGLRYSDIFTLENKHIDGNWLRKVMVKTAQPIDIPLHEKAEEIINKYIDLNDGTSSLIFPQLSNQKYNVNLKRIAAQVGISKKITTHTGRHTFATILANKTNDAFLIRDFLGHTSMRETMRYVNMSHDKKIQAINLL